MPNDVQLVNPNCCTVGSFFRPYGMKDPCQPAGNIPRKTNNGSFPIRNGSLGGKGKIKDTRPKWEFPPEIEWGGMPFEKKGGLS